MKAKDIYTAFEHATESSPAMLVGLQLMDGRLITPELESITSYLKDYRTAQSMAIEPASIITALQCYDTRGRHEMFIDIDFIASITLE